MLIEIMPSPKRRVVISSALMTPNAQKRLKELSSCAKNMSRNGKKKNETYTGKTMLGVGKNDAA